MGKGIAKQLRETFPAIFKADQDNGRKADYDKIGTCSSALVGLSGGKRLVLVNAYTQHDYWSPGDTGDKVYVDYDAVRLCFRKIKRNWGNSGKKFGIPLIGAGLAKGDWNVLSKIIDEEMAGENLTLVRFGEAK
jgi:O-acetyl-ADP-ribose deacetylase (regulator of RNase III)